ncbi:MAG: cell division protein FtsZ [Candidatus Heimdallarchaeota archaeon]|nr:cell division protein FtsZ [Candidatus Heimdallarchaeota archaeon]MDH5646735.1 cell division protein FtsZ [Candidatus Heimdallarchaeota archaeon]
MTNSIKNLLDTLDEEMEEISQNTFYLNNKNSVNYSSTNNSLSSTGSSEVDKLLDSLIKKNKNRIVAIGVGGAGCNAINRLHLSEFKGVLTVGANTDAIHLRDIKSDDKVLLGLNLTEGLGAGNDPVIGKAAAEESVEVIKPVVNGSDMVFVTTGMGGGTGTGAAPIIAQIAKKSGALVVGVCTLPFEMEGEIRAKHSLTGLNEFFKACDTVIVIPNEKLMHLVPDLPISLAFKVADEILVRAVKGIVNLILTPAYVNVDFADIRQILKRGGTSVIGMGEGEGENRIEDALRESLSNSLLDIQIMDCKAALINISGGPSLSLEEVRKCVQSISQEMSEDSEIIWGTHIDKSLEDKIQVTTILSGVTSPYNLNLQNIMNDGQEISSIHLQKNEISSIWE